MLTDPPLSLYDLVAITCKITHVANIYQPYHQHPMLIWCAYVSHPKVFEFNLNLHIFYLSFLPTVWSLPSWPFMVSSLVFSLWSFLMVPSLAAAHGFLTGRSSWFPRWLFPMVLSLALPHGSLAGPPPYGFPAGLPPYGFLAGPPYGSLLSPSSSSHLISCIFLLYCLVIHMYSTWNQNLILFFKWVLLYHWQLQVTK